MSNAEARNSRNYLNWTKYRETGYIPDNENLLSMIDDLVELIHTIDDIYGLAGRFVTDKIVGDYHSLVVMARARDLEYRRL